MLFSYIAMCDSPFLYIFVINEFYTRWSASKRHICCFGVNTNASVSSSHLINLLLEWKQAQLVIKVKCPGVGTQIPKFKQICVWIPLFPHSRFFTLDLFASISCVLRLCKLEIILTNSFFMVFGFSLCIDQFQHDFPNFQTSDVDTVTKLFQ